MNKLKTLEEKIIEMVKLTIHLYPHKHGEELSGQINEKISDIFQEEIFNLTEEDLK